MFWVTFNLLPASALNLDGAKILPSCEGLKGDPILQ